MIPERRDCIGTALGPAAMLAALAVIGQAKPQVVVIGGQTGGRTRPPEADPRGGIDPGEAQLPLAVIVVSDGTIPAVLAEADAPSLPAASPLVSQDAARIWPGSLAPPSRWFSGVADACAHIDRLRNLAPMNGRERAAIPAELGQNRADFATAPGSTGNEAMRIKQVWEMEQGLTAITPAKARLARALAAERRLSLPPQDAGDGA